MVNCKYYIFLLVSLILNLKMINQIRFIFLNKKVLYLNKHFFNEKLILHITCIYKILNADWFKNIIYCIMYVIYYALCINYQLIKVIILNYLVIKADYLILVILIIMYYTNLVNDHQGRFQSFCQGGARWRAKRAEIFWPPLVNFWSPPAGGCQFFQGGANH